MAQEFHDLFRFSVIGKCGKAAQVEKDNGNFSAVGPKQIGFFAKDRFCDLRRKIALEARHALEVGHLFFYRIQSVRFHSSSVSCISLSRIIARTRAKSSKESKGLVT